MQILRVFAAFMLILVSFPHCTKTVVKDPESPITKELVMRAQNHLVLLTGHHSVEYIHDLDTDTWSLLYNTTYERQPPDPEERAKYWDNSYALKARFAFSDVLQGNWGQWTEITYIVHFLYNEYGPGGNYLVYKFPKDHPAFK